MSKFAQKLGIGTVQFGLDYGISNTDGQVTLSEARKIIHYAAEIGIRTIDTAAVYGDSERVLGEILPTDHKFEVITKTVQFGAQRIQPRDAADLTTSFHLSLSKLKNERVHGLLAHNADDLLADGGELLWRAMENIKREGKVSKIGASIYTGAQIDCLLDRYPVELVQIPINAFDQRFLTGGYVARLKKAGVEVHARSLFLQGALLMTPDELPANFDSIREHHSSYHAECADADLTPLEASLAYVTGMSEIDCSVVGVCSRSHLREINQALSASDRCELDYARFAVDDENIINPSRWKVHNES